MGAPSRARDHDWATRLGEHVASAGPHEDSAEEQWQALYEVNVNGETVDDVQKLMNDAAIGRPLPIRLFRGEQFVETELVPVELLE